MKFIAIIAMLCTAFMTLTAVVFCLAMGANSSVEEIHILKLWMLGLTLLGLAGIVASIFQLRAKQARRAAIAAFAPTVIILVIFMIAILI